MNLLQPVKTTDKAEYQLARSLVQNSELPARYKGIAVDSVVQYLIQELPIEQLISDPKLLNQLEVYLQESNPALLKNPDSTVLDQVEIRQAIDEAVKQEIIAEFSKIPYNDLVADLELRDWIKQQLEALLPHIDFERSLSERGYAEQFDAAIDDAIHKEANDE